MLSPYGCFFFPYVGGEVLSGYHCEYMLMLYRRKSVILKPIYVL